jgi:hypothetical protein
MLKKTLLATGAIGATLLLAAAVIPALADPAQADGKVQSSRVTGEATGTPSAGDRRDQRDQRVSRENGREDGHARDRSEVRQRHDRSGDGTSSQGREPADD